MPVPVTSDDRAAVVGYLRRQVLGPVDGEAEVLSEVPHRRYLTGMLFPTEAAVDEQLDEDIVDEAAGEAGDESTEDPIALSAQQLPSSVGLSFVVPTWEGFRVEVHAGRYHHEGKDWRREAIVLTGEEAPELAPPHVPGSGGTVAILDGWASLETTWRRLGTGALVTVALVNRRSLPSDGRMDPQDCLLQVRMRCIGSQGFVPYPSPMRLQTGDEEAELALQYRDVPTYAIGHGCAAAWESTAGVPAWVETSYLPEHTVPAVAFTPHRDAEPAEGEPDPLLKSGTGSVLRLSFLAGISERPSEVIAALDAFVDRYDDWTRLREDEAATLPNRHSGAAKRLLSRVDVARRRMRRGVRRLERDETARHAFQMANEAMLMQMVRGGSDYAGRSRPLDEPLPPAPKYDEAEHDWRPFQLAFLLLALESTIDESADDRDLIDLIWFPTGGGKTEAYLGLMALSILHRRLMLRDDGAGTTVLTRYTLRLLTSQQFQRASTLICALELLRRGMPDRLGTTRISIGIWLGRNNSPNSYADAVELLQKLQNSEYTNISFQVEACPWCGTELIPSTSHSPEAWGVTAANDAFRLNCPRGDCDFHEELPVSSVDEDLYDRPPTCLIGTVDKFARLTWEPRAGVFLGAANTPGPSLVIQDEFHLISGPLGTMVGLYEAAFDVVMSEGGARPKVVASTATIRRAEAQGRGVFGRDTALFPPAGLSADDSFFVRHDPSKPGRRYVGVMAQGHTPLTSMVHVSASLLQSSEELTLQPPSDDAYWTLVAYHNSLRELGKSVTLAHDDIPARLQVIATAEDAVRRLQDDDIVELTGNVPAAEIPRHLELLKRPRGEKGAVSFVASTNMLSVGVDVPRLGLMLMVGQPKTTSEYIQATSRVGRRTPGLVVTLYSATKPRDRSHYESFVAYHSALYRYVEPTSVTPFSVPARSRALHAGLVILLRHALGLSQNPDASRFDRDDPEFVALVEAFLRRVEVADPSEREDVARHLAELEGEWEHLAEQAHPSGGLRYAGGGKERVALLKRFTEPGRGWATLDSMRSVDTEVRMRIRGEES
ncbi:helicase-related protein [Terracoccus sp. 273MFTsu3.1]|uniref:helicase-related protein n=1 Tax=Terracoccus sp. 273MFTsu3.1 TaxID=1172188 RepID=UPI00036C2216|nr:helicase-related protein [Terracoccus sp. 273MFTsu3.1]